MLSAYWNAVVVLRADTLSFCLALRKLVFVLKLGTHSGGWVYVTCEVVRVL